MNWFGVFFCSQIDSYGSISMSAEPTNVALMLTTAFELANTPIYLSVFPSVRPSVPPQSFEWLCLCYLVALILRELKDRI